MRQGAEGTAVAEEGQPPSFAAFRLPPGKHGIPPGQVVENQRWRLLGAAAEALAERGYAHLRTADVCARAGVSRETLYEHFEGLDACLAAAYEMTADCVLDLVSARGEGEAADMRGALDEVLGFLATEPSLAHLLGPEAPAAVPAIAAARERLVRELVGAGLARRRLEGAFALVSDRVATGDASSLTELADPLAELLCRGRPTDAVR